MRIFILFFLLALAGSETLLSSESIGGFPDSTTPKQLAESWLRFHSMELCQGIDAVFSFSEKGMEVSGTILNEKSRQKLDEMLQPLRSLFKIEERLEQPEKDEDKEEGVENKEKDPPASLWENYQLRSFLGDPLARARERTGFDEDSQLNFPPPDDLLRQRLYIYAEQTLAWNAQVERYATHIPALTRMVVDSSLSNGLRSKAQATAAAHAKQMHKLLGKLISNLAHALPSEKDKEIAIRGEKTGPEPKTAVECADALSVSARATALRVYQFIHPEHYTVGISELRQPSLLESLEELRGLESEFLKSLAKAK